MIKKLHSATKIAQMGLPGLPKSRDNIRIRATNENWYFEEQKGVGGTRRMYEIPARYLAQGDSAAPEESPVPAPEGSKVAGTITPGGTGVDLRMVKFADEVLEEWLQAKGLRLKPERRAGVLAVLCDYLAKGASANDLKEMLKVLSA